MVNHRTPVEAMKKPDLADIMRDPAAAMHRIHDLEKAVKELCDILEEACKVLKKARK